MLKGAFASMTHQHYFEQHGELTTMRDVFSFRSPFGPFGRLAEILFLESYMRRFLTQRNSCIKKWAESRVNA